MEDTQDLTPEERELISQSPSDFGIKTKQKDVEQIKVVLTHHAAMRIVDRLTKDENPSTLQKVLQKTLRRGTLTTKSVFEAMLYFEGTGFYMPLKRDTVNDSMYFAPTLKRLFAPSDLKHLRRHGKKGQSVEVDYVVR